MKRLVLLMVLAAAFHARPAVACSCIGGGPPCAAAFRVSAVFAGTVRDITPVQNRPGMLAVRFAVDLRGPGVNTNSIVVESTPQNGGNCGFDFHVGERYVVYAYAQPNLPLTTNMCSQTKLARNGQADIAFLEEFARRPRGVRVFGTVRRVETDLTAFGARDFGTVSGAQIQIAGGRVSRETTTDASGAYEFRDLPTGTYTVTMTMPAGLAVAEPPLPGGQRRPTVVTVRLTHPSECADVSMWPRNNAQITGMLLSHDGSPAAGQPVDLIAASNAASTEKAIPHVSVRTDADGRFIFPLVAPGTYLVGLNLEMPPPASQLDRRAFHPGVADAARATVVTIDAASRVALAPFQAPDLPRERRITGTVVWSDGGAVPAAHLTLTTGPQGDRSEAVPLDAEGRFSVTIPYGEKFWLFAQARRRVRGEFLTGGSIPMQCGPYDRDGEVSVVIRVPR